MKQKKLIFNFIVNRNCKKLTDSRKRAKILADNRKSHNPVETLLQAHKKEITREISVRERRERAHEERALSFLFFAFFLNPSLFLVSLFFTIKYTCSIGQLSDKFPRGFLDT